MDAYSSCAAMASSLVKAASAVVVGTGGSSSAANVTGGNPSIRGMMGFHDPLPVEKRNITVPFTGNSFWAKQYNITFAPQGDSTLMSDFIKKLRVGAAPVKEFNEKSKS